METSSWWYHHSKMVRLRRQCCTLAFLFKSCIFLLAVSSVLLLLQSIWSSSSVEEKTGAGKSGRLNSNTINSGAFIEREYLPKEKFVSHSSECEVPRFNSNSTIPQDVVCKRISPRPGSCQLAHELYTSQKVETCSHQEKHQLCQIKGEGKEMAVECDQEICPGPVSLGTINPAIGVLHWEELSDMKELQAHLQHLLLTGKPEAVFGFCFIKCPLELQEVQEGGQGGENIQAYDVDEDEEEGLEDGVENSFLAFEKDYFQEDVDDEPWAQQLLLLPSKQQKSHSKSQSSSPGLNINVILLDSVSHSHFYRSLPRTVHTLREINKLKAGSVFNYNLVQSVKGRTYENIQVLFSGVMYNPEEPFGVHDMPPDPVGTKVLLEGFKHMGYETLWMEDLCWTWEWGIAKNFVVHSPKEMLSFRWQKLLDAMKEGGVDQLGLALASCEILHRNNHNDPFHGPPAICYNGEYQHTYMLQYLKSLQKAQQSSRTPFFHYTEINVGHDDLGIRVQGLDTALADYLTFAASLDNTMTILLADHGNAYGSFIHKSEEGRIEMFHPSMFIMLSKNAGRFLSPSQVHALEVNQDRLTSILDIHYMLRSLAYPGLKTKVAESHQNFDINPTGLLQEVSMNRTCDHIPRIQPNICICEDYDSRVSNDSSRVIFAEFALGELNNAIQNQFVEAHPEARRGFGRCQPLQALRFTNVRENFHGDDTIVIKLDLHIKAGENASQTEEIFFVTLMASTNTQPREQLRLISYDRLTAYSQYGACADKGVATKLCVCSLARLDAAAKKATEYGSTPKWHEISSFFSAYTSTVKEVTSCLYLYERRTPNGVVLEASCECSDRLYLVEINAKSQNIIVSKELPVSIVLKPGMRTFLVAFVQSIRRKTWSLEYSMQYTEHRLV
ncbi:uncharacterized protein LOC115922218 [Strongylocentrotus purpuratus]|uniref:Uncharacterized protein n=1 Tax=Strongylocentrotus purpuratus TaxID=7668 RepID=A0A7M7NH13_STRPU|nr:uncharacterized protein LOC115922218 [Strongylocentrotus purpuratus]